MNLKWIGAILIILASGGTGFSLASAHRQKETQLRQLLSALDYMQCELQYRMIPLPDLCRQTGSQSQGWIQKLFLGLAAELEDQVAPDVQCCIRDATDKLPGLPEVIAEPVRILGETLGRFDLEGQIKGLEAGRQACRRSLESLISNREERLRSYQTLGLCAGAAIAILLL